MTGPPLGRGSPRAQLSPETRVELVTELAARPDCFELMRRAMDDPTLRELTIDAALEGWKSLASQDGSAAQSWRLARWLADCGVGRNTLRDFATDASLVFTERASRGVSARRRSDDGSGWRCR